MDLRLRQPHSADSAGSGSATPPLFALALATFAVSVVVAIALVASAACGGNGGNQPTGSGGHIGTATPTATTAATTAAATATTPTARPTTATSSPTPAPQSQAPTTQGPDTSALVGCTLLAPVDQNHRVDRDCVLGPLVDIGGGMSLNADAATAFAKLVSAAAAEKLNLFAVSAYRSFDTQASLFDQEVRTYGPDQKTVARPGHSEHQLGTTLDVNDISEAFGTTAEGKWLAQNAAKYGFVISYPAGKESLSGYAYEPWHIRYVGVGTAQAAVASGTTLNRFLGGG